MRLSVSNIAWPAEVEGEVAQLLAGEGISGVEVAPTKRWPRPDAASEAEILEYRAWWEERGLRVVAMQSLLFGRDDLTIFGAEPARAATLAYLERVIALGGSLGAHALVFGSPKNRRVGSLARADVQEIAVEFFGAVGESARRHGLAFCIEPNPPEYGCDYLVRAQECIALLEEIDEPGLGLHLDSAAMTLAGEPIDATVASAMPWLRHFHVSEPFLAPIGSGGVDHERLAASLAAHGYDGWLSIEMRAVDSPAAAVRSAVQRTVEAYRPILRDRA